VARRARPALDKPVIAATSGWVVGGGFVLVLLCFLEVLQTWSARQNRLHIGARSHQQ
jgi:1,4-dihydroxy-2-naphthoyl-CoA synthase